MLKKLIFAAAALAMSAPALADREWRHERDDDYRHHHYRHHYRGHYYPHYPRPVVVAPPPQVYYAPAPVYYYAPPPRVYYAPPPPVYYHPPVPHSGISVRLHFPL